MVTSGEHPGEVASDKLQQRPVLDSVRKTTQHETGIHTLQTHEGTTPSIIPEKPLEEHDAGCHISQIDKEGSISSIILSEASQSPGTGLHTVQSGQEGRTPSIIREKVLEDGYHWRKYGQKLVKGNEFVRSYYRCTHPNCQVKKQLECSHNGKITDVLYFGQHDHPKQQINVPVAVGFVLSIAEEKPAEPSPTKVKDGQAYSLVKPISASEMRAVKSTENVKSAPSESNKIKKAVDNGDDPRSKRQKKGSSSVDTSSSDKATDEPHLVVQTLSEVEIVNDGYRWRKYGQKLVKGNTNPRSYYRCSSPGCPTKKHVERASHDPKVVITSYEGQHNHDMPALRTVTHITTATGLNVSTSTQNGQSVAKSGESAGSSNIVADNSLGLNGKSKEQVNGDSKSKLKECNNPDTETDVHPGSGHESKPRVNQNGKSRTAEETDTAGHDMVSECRSNEEHIGKSRTESKENATASCAQASSPESKPNDQCMPSSQPVRT